MGLKSGLECCSYALSLYIFFINIFAKYCVFFPVTSQTLENCSEEVRSVVSQIPIGAAKTEPTTMTTTMPLVPAMVKFIHESEALNMVSGAGDTVLIGKAYMTYMTE